MLVLASFYSIFQPLTDVFQSVLKFFHNSGGISWGWSIVLLTVAVRAVLVPLTLRQLRSMARMQVLGPQMKEIQNKYKDDKQRQQQEIMKFYRENNVNPAAACLPMLAQFPVFIALYAMLRQSLRTDICPRIQRLHNHGVLSIHHTIACGNVPAAHFLGITDLTNKATGITLVVMLVLYIGSQISSSLVMMPPSAEPVQRYMMFVLPLIFVTFVFRFPSGLVVYWITTNLWTLGQSFVVRQRMGAHRAALEAAGAAGAPAVAVAAAGGGSASNGDSDATGGGIGAMFRERLRSAQDAAAGTSGNGTSGNGTSGNGNAGGARSGGASRRRSGDSETRASANRGARAANASGSRTKTAGNGRTSANGQSTSSGQTGNGSSSSAPGVPPPRSPRKKKKRSGRRR